MHNLKNSMVSLQLAMAEWRCDVFFCFFFSSLLFPRESLTRTVLLVSLQAAGAP